MTYVKGSSTVWRFNRQRRAQALNFADRALFPVWYPPAPVVLPVAPADK